MKLWKIMLAVIVAVLMISCVAMADTHVCADTDFQRINGTTNQEIYGYKNLGTATAPNYVHSYIESWTEMCKVCGTTKTVREDKVNQVCSINWGIPVEATCTSVKYRTGACTTCGQSTYEELAGKADHDWIYGPWVPATCQTYAYHVDVCADCGKTVTVEDKENGRSGHDWKPDILISDATCKVKAKYGIVCSMCKTVQPGTAYEKGDKAGHDYAWTNTIEPTCTTAGVKTGVCKVCGDKGGYSEVAALGHKANYSTLKTEWPTCTTWGKVTADCYVCGVNYKVEDKAPINHEGKKTTYNYVEATCGYEGHHTYTKCSACGMMWDWENRVITEIPVIPANGKHILSWEDKIADIKDCTSSNNYADGNCEICGIYTRVYVPATEHSWPAIKNSNLVANSDKEAATCTETGKGYIKCANCEEYKYVTVPATGHNFKTWTYGAAATCTTDFTAESTCANGDCGFKTVKVIEEALGHNWILQAGTDATCTASGVGTRMCTRCKNTQQNVTIPAKGHDYTKTIEVVKPTCDAQGYTVFGCVRCDATQKGAYTAALGHAYSWVVVTKPSEAGNGKNEYTCSACKKVAETKTVKYSKMYYNNTMTADGTSIRDLVGGNDWYRVTSVNLAVDGVYTYDLVASNKYVVGSVTIAVNGGTLTVSYKAKADVDVKDEQLLIYTSKENLAAGSAVTAPVGAAINIAETFGAETDVLVSLILTGDYDAAGKTLASK